MNKFKYLIIGGGIAGTSAAESIRQKDKEGGLAIISDEPYRLYSRIMLSKPPLFLGKIPFDKVWLKTEEWYEENQIHLIKGKSALKLDAKNKKIRLDDGRDIEYEKLLLATGVNARPWEVKGCEKPCIHGFRDMDDCRAIMKEAKNAKHAVTVGGGFISFEMNHLLRLAGVEVTNVIMETYFWNPLLAPQAGAIVEDAMIKAGVKIVRENKVVEVLGKEQVEAVLLKDGTKHDCQMIVAGIGVEPDNEWLKGSGVDLEKGILADEYLQSSLPDVWVAGDAAQYQDVILNEKVIMGNWANAQQQGKIAGSNMLGEKLPYRFISFYTATAFGLSIAFVGDVRPLPERNLIDRPGKDNRSYGRLIMRENNLVGATLVNMNQDLTVLRKLAENEVDLSEHFEDLKEPDFDLNSLIK